MGLFPFSFYLLSFSTHIPLLELIESETNKTIKSIKKLSHFIWKNEFYELFFLFQHFHLKKLIFLVVAIIIENLTFFIKTISVNALGPSIFPYSLKFAANATWNGGNIHSNLALSLNKTTIDIDKTRITLHTTLPKLYQKCSLIRIT